MTRKTLPLAFLPLLFSADAFASDPSGLLDQLQGLPGLHVQTEHLKRYGPTDARADGTVVVQGLQWMRCALGQNWTGHTCSGEAVRVTWNQAQHLTLAMNQSGGFAGRSDWRLPTIAELETLRLCSNGMAQGIRQMPGKGEVFEKCVGTYFRPTLDRRLFPNATTVRLWSATPDGTDSTHSWVVRLFDGSMSYDPRSYVAGALLVRDPR